MLLHQIGQSDIKLTRLTHSSCKDNRITWKTHLDNSLNMLMGRRVGSKLIGIVSLTQTLVSLVNDSDPINEFGLEKVRNKILAS